MGSCVVEGSSASESHGCKLGGSTHGSIEIIHLPLVNARSRRGTNGAEQAAGQDMIYSGRDRWHKIERHNEDIVPLAGSVGSDGEHKVASKLLFAHRLCILLQC